MNGTCCSVLSGSVVSDSATRLNPEEGKDQGRFPGVSNWKGRLNKLREHCCRPKEGRGIQQLCNSLKRGTSPGRNETADP